MKVDIQFGPANAAAKLQLDPGETVVAEAGAMIGASGDIRLQTNAFKRGQGGVMGSLKRMVSGESFFINEFTAGGSGGEVWVATTLSGDMRTLDIGQGRMIVQSGSFVACENAVELDASWQGFKSLFSKEGLFWIKMGGSGQVVINSFGAIYPIEVDGEYIVDTGHIVAFDETLNFRLSKAGKSWLSSFLGGEGLICRFSGKGTVWCQSHNAPGFGRTLGRMLRPRKR